MRPLLHQIPLLPFCVIFLSSLFLLLSNACFCFAQHSVQGQAVGFLHSGVLITGSHVSCSHLFPPLPHLFIPPPPMISSRFSSLNIWTSFKERARSTSKTEAERVNLLLLSPTLPPRTGLSGPSLHHSHLPRMLHCSSGSV